MEKKYHKRSLVDEKEKFGVGTKNIVLYLIGLYVLIAIFVSLILYKPSIPKDKKDVVSNSDYTANEEEIAVGLFGESCSKSTLNEIVKESSKIKFSYRITKYDTGLFATSQDPDEPDPIPYYEYGYELSFSNIGENIYLNVSNDINDDIYEINKNKDEPNYSFVFEDILSISKFRVVVYSKNENCNEEKVREYVLTLPRFNVNSLVAICWDSDSKSCEQLIYEEASEYIIPGYDENGDKKEEENKNEVIETSKKPLKIFEFRISNILIITSVIYIVLVGIVYAFYISVYKKKVSDE